MIAAAQGGPEADGATPQALDVQDGGGVADLAAPEIALSDVVWAEQRRPAQGSGRRATTDAGRCGSSADREFPSSSHERGVPGFGGHPRARTIVRFRLVRQLDPTSTTSSC